MVGLIQSSRKMYLTKEKRFIMPLPWLIGGAAVVLGGAVAAALSEDDSTTFPKIKESNRVGKTSTLNEVIGVIISSKEKSLNLKQREFSDLIG